MLTRPLTLNDSEDGGRALVMHPASRLVDGGEDDDDIQRGVLASAAPPWGSTSSSPSSPPRCASSSSSSTSSSLTLPSFFSSPTVVTSSSASHSLISPSCSTLLVSVLSPSPHSAPPPHPVAPSLFSSTLSAPSHVPSVPTSRASSTSMFPPPSHSSPPSRLPTPPSQPSPPPHFSSTPNLCGLPPLAPPSRPPLPSAFSSTTSTIFTIPAASCVSSSHSLNPPSLPSSTPPVQPCLHPPPPSQLYPHLDHLQPSPLAPSLASSSSVLRPIMHNSFSSAPFRPLLYQCSFANSPPPPPTLHIPCTSQTSICPPFSPSSPAVDASPSTSPSPLSLTTSTLPPPAHPPAPPPCCPCSSLLPRLLSAHRLEVRRMLRGALASLGRRLDSLERRSRRKIRKKRGMQRGGEGGAGTACSSGLLSSASSCSPAHLPIVSSSSSSSDSEDSHSPSSSLSQSQQRRRRRGGAEEEMERDRKRRRRNRGRRQISGALEEREEDEEEEDAGRFVGRMAVSFKGGAEGAEAPLTLHNYNHKNYRDRVETDGPTDQSEKAVSDVRRNGFKASMLLHSSTSQNALRRLRSPHSGRSDSQSEALDLFPGKWHFSDDTPPINNRFNHTDFHLWLGSSSSGFRPTLMLRLSAVAVKTMSESIRGGASEEPLRPLKDWTAPPSLSSDHCYMRTASLSSTSSARRQLKQRVSHSSKSLHLPRRRPLPLPTCPANGLSALLPPGQSAVGSEFLNANGERVKRVSQIRIRRGPPRETPLTPMGLPKAKRLKKKEFSLEEIYTNKNYKSPTSNRSLETIFEEPREKDGALLTIGYQKRRRLLLFPDFTQPRKRKKPQGVGLPFTAMPRKRAAARRCHGSRHIDDESDIDVMLVERLSALEDFLTQQGLEV